MLRLKHVTCRQNCEGPASFARVRLRELFGGKEGAGRASHDVPACELLPRYGASVREEAGHFLSRARFNEEAICSRVLTCLVMCADAQRYCVVSISGPCCSLTVH